MLKVLRGSTPPSTTPLNRSLFSNGGKILLKGVLKMSFGEKLKYYRKINRYSQKQLANELGIALSTYGKYETNEYQIGRAHV